MNEDEGLDGKIKKRTSVTFRLSGSQSSATDTGNFNVRTPDGTTQNIAAESEATLTRVNRGVFGFIPQQMQMQAGVSIATYTKGPITAVSDDVESNARRLGESLGEHREHHARDFDASAHIQHLHSSFGLGRVPVFHTMLAQNESLVHETAIAKARQQKTGGRKLLVGAAMAGVAIGMAVNNRIKINTIQTNMEEMRQNITKSFEAAAGLANAALTATKAQQAQLDDIEQKFDIEREKMVAMEAYRETATAQMGTVVHDIDLLTSGLDLTNDRVSGLATRQLEVQQKMTKQFSLQETEINGLWSTTDTLRSMIGEGAKTAAKMQQTLEGQQQMAVARAENTQKRFAAVEATITASTNVLKASVQAGIDRAAAAIQAVDAAANTKITSLANAVNDKIVLLGSATDVRIDNVEQQTTAQLNLIRQEAITLTGGLEDLISNVQQNTKSDLEDLYSYTSTQLVSLANDTRLLRDQMMDQINGSATTIIDWVTAEIAYDRDETKKSQEWNIAQLEQVNTDISEQFRLAKSDIKQLKVQLHKVNVETHSLRAITQNINSNTLGRHIVSTQYNTVRQKMVDDGWTPFLKRNGIARNNAYKVPAILDEVVVISPVYNSLDPMDPAENVEMTLGVYCDPDYLVDQTYAFDDMVYIMENVGPANCRFAYQSYCTNATDTDSFATECDIGTAATACQCETVDDPVVTLGVGYPKCNCAVKARARSCLGTDKILTDPTLTAENVGLDIVDEIEPIGSVRDGLKLHWKSLVDGVVQYTVDSDDVYEILPTCNMTSVYLGPTAISDSDLAAMDASADGFEWLRVNGKLPAGCIKIKDTERICAGEPTDVAPGYSIWSADSEYITSLEQLMALLADIGSETAIPGIHADAEYRLRNTTHFFVRSTRRFRSLQKAYTFAQTCVRTTSPGAGNANACPFDVFDLMNYEADTVALNAVDVPTAAPSLTFIVYDVLGRAFGALYEDMWLLETMKYGDFGEPLFLDTQLYGSSGGQTSQRTETVGIAGTKGGMEMISKCSPGKTSASINLVAMEGNVVKGEWVYTNPTIEQNAQYAIPTSFIWAGHPRCAMLDGCKPPPVYADLAPDSGVDRVRYVYDLPASTVSTSVFLDARSGSPSYMIDRYHYTTQVAELEASVSQLQDDFPAAGSNNPVDFTPPMLSFNEWDASFNARNESTAMFAVSGVVDSLHYYFREVGDDGKCIGAASYNNEICSMLEHYELVYCGKYEKTCDGQWVELMLDPTTVQPYTGIQSLVQSGIDPAVECASTGAAQDSGGGARTDTDICWWPMATAAVMLVKPVADPGVCLELEFAQREAVASPRTDTNLCVWQNVTAPNAVAGHSYMHYKDTDYQTTDTAAFGAVQRMLPKWNADKMATTRAEYISACKEGAWMEWDVCLKAREWAYEQQAYVAEGDAQITTSITQGCPTKWYVEAVGVGMVDIVLENDANAAVNVWVEMDVPGYDECAVARELLVSARSDKRFPISNCGTQASVHVWGVVDTPVGGNEKNASNARFNLQCMPTGGLDATGQVSFEQENAASQVQTARVFTTTLVVVEDSIARQLDQQSAAGTKKMYDVASSVESMAKFDNAEREQSRKAMLVQQAEQQGTIKEINFLWETLHTLFDNQEALRSDPASVPPISFESSTPVESVLRHANGTLKYFEQVTTTEIYGAPMEHNYTLDFVNEASAKVAVSIGALETVSVTLDADYKAAINHTAAAEDIAASKRVLQLMQNNLTESMVSSEDVSAFTAEVESKIAVMDAIKASSHDPDAMAAGVVDIKSSIAASFDFLNNSLAAINAITGELKKDVADLKVLQEEREAINANISSLDAKLVEVMDNYSMHGEISRQAIKVLENKTNAFVKLVNDTWTNGGFDWSDDSIDFGNLLDLVKNVTLAALNAAADLVEDVGLFGSGLFSGLGSGLLSALEDIIIVVIVVGVCACVGYCILQRMMAGGVSRIAMGRGPKDEQPLLPRMRRSGHDAENPGRWLKSSRRKTKKKTGRYSLG